MRDLALDPQGLLEAFQAAEDRRRAEGFVAGSRAALRVAGDPGRPSPARRFVESQAYQEAIARGDSHAPFNVHRQVASAVELGDLLRTRGLTVPTTLPPPYREPGAVLRPVNVRVSQLVRSIPVTGARVDFISVTGRAPAAAPTPAGTQLPQTSVTLTANELICFRFGCAAYISWDVFASPYQLEAAIEQILLDDFAYSLERQILNGAGGAGAILGLVNDAGITSLARGSQYSWQLIGQGIETVQNNEATGDLAVVINPTTYRIMRNTMASTGDLAVQALQETYPEISAWVPHAGVPVGNAVVGDFDAFHLFITEEGLAVEASEEDQTNWLIAQVTLRAQSRIEGQAADKTRFAVLTGL